MPVAQFREHLAENLELLPVGQPVVHGGRVTRVDFVPIKPVFALLFRKEAVMLVHDAPKRVEVAACRVLCHVLLDAARAQQASRCKERQEAERYGAKQARHGLDENYDGYKIYGDYIYINIVYFFFGRKIAMRRT